MSDVTNDKMISRKFSHDDVKKDSIAFGKATTETVIKEKPSLIPDKTPGREISIKPRSPFRELRSESTTASTRKTTSSDQGSVRLEDSDRGTTVRSVYEIGNRRNSPTVSHPGSSPGHGGYPAIASAGGNMPPPPMYYATPPPVHQQQQPMYYPQQPMYYPHQQMIPQMPPQPEYPDYDEMTEDAQKEARLIFKSKFASLKDNYPERNFDDYDPDLPLIHIHKIYEDHLKKISIESNSSITRILLVLMFLAIEAFGTKVLNLDLQGYTKNQVASMKRYDRLLLELGEKYAGGTGNWPIEARLIFLAVINAVVILGVKLICSKIGIGNADKLIDYVNGVIGGGIDGLVEAKPEPLIDPVTKTADPTPNDSGRDLMGGVNQLMNFAGNMFGNKNGDIAETIGNVGSEILNAAGKPGTKDKKSKRGVRFGNRK